MFSRHHSSGSLKGDSCETASKSNETGMWHYFDDFFPVKVAALLPLLDRFDHVEDRPSAKDCQTQSFGTLAFCTTKQNITVRD